MRQLEDGLRESHALVSPERHPLLAEHLLLIKAPLQRDPPHLRNLPKSEVKQEDQNGEVVDAFGSLSINAFGGANYYGSIASSWVSAYLIMSIFLCSCLPFIGFSPIQLLLQVNTLFRLTSIFTDLQQRTKSLSTRTATTTTWMC